MNAANEALLGCFIPCHACIDNVIHTWSGVQLRLTCDALMKQQGHEEPTGHAKITEAYNLPSRYIMHTVGPIVEGNPTQDDCALLASCYRSCLEVALERRLSSIAFCCISTGVFSFPQERAAEIAIGTIKNFLRANAAQMKVICNVFKRSDYEIYQRLLTGGCAPPADR